MLKVLSILLFLPLAAVSQINGEIIFNTNCAACHTIGKGNMVGPDLEGLLDRREESWARKFIQSSQSLIAEGDSLALVLFQENNYVPMPDQLLSEDELTAVLEFIDASAMPPPIAENENQIETKALGNNKNLEKDKKSAFLDFINRPINWIFAFALLVILSVFYTLLKVIKTLAEYNIRNKIE